MKADRIFKSKRNVVFLKNNIVYKKSETAEREAGILKNLFEKNVPVPRVISCREGLLAMEYIEGDPFAEYLEKMERAGADSVTGPLLDWFASFYGAVEAGNIRGDVNGRNFIVTPDRRIVGLDFEEQKRGKKETDAGRLLAYILTYRPEFTPFKESLARELGEKFISRFSLDASLVREEKQKELEAMRLRRMNKKIEP